MTLSRKTKALFWVAALFTSATTAQARPNTVINMMDDTFQAYGSPDYKPSGCDVGSTVILETGSLRGPIASLSDDVAGICELYVAPNPRTYALMGEDIGCGSILWTGFGRTNDGNTSIEITDHRTRLCDDLVPNVLIIKESNSHGEKTLYGHFPAPQPM